MNKQIVLLAASILLFSTLSIAVEAQNSGTNDKLVTPTEVVKPGADSTGAKAKKATVPETQKDRDNKKKCRNLGGTYQLGHCNVG
jgi:hypothetical protein